MIKSKKELKYYLLCDEIARFNHRSTFLERLKVGVLWSYNKVLRKMEYNLNCNNGLKKTILNLYYKYKLLRLSRKTGWYVQPNTFGPGLCIVHVGPVIVNGNSRFGSNVRIQAMVNIGAHKGKAPVAGNMIYIGPGAKLYGNIKLGSNIAIGANAVVNKDFIDDNITIGGVPAKIVSNHGCEELIINSEEYLKNNHIV